MLSYSERQSTVLLYCIVFYIPNQYHIIREYGLASTFILKNTIKTGGKCPIYHFNIPLKALSEHNQSSTKKTAKLT